MVRVYKIHDFHISIHCLCKQPGNAFWSHPSSEKVSKRVTRLVRFEMRVQTAHDLKRLATQVWRRVLSEVFLRGSAAIEEKCGTPIRRPVLRGVAITRVQKGPSGHMPWLWHKVIFHPHWWLLFTLCSLTKSKWCFLCQLFLYTVSHIHIGKLSSTTTICNNSVAQNGSPLSVASTSPCWQL